MKHKALRRFDKHLTRIVWIFLAICILVWIHPLPVEVKAISILVGISIISFSIGVTIANRLVVKSERNDKGYLY